MGLFRSRKNSESTELVDHACSFATYMGRWSIRIVTCHAFSWCGGHVVPSVWHGMLSHKYPCIGRTWANQLFAGLFTNFRIKNYISGLALYSVFTQYLYFFLEHDQQILLARFAATINALVTRRDNDRFSGIFLQDHEIPRLNELVNNLHI